MEPSTLPPVASPAWYDLSDTQWRGRPPVIVRGDDPTASPVFIARGVNNSPLACSSQYDS